MPHGHHDLLDVIKLTQFQCNKVDSIPMKLSCLHGSVNKICTEDVLVKSTQVFNFSPTITCEL